jgi:hypothetical protein
VPALPPFIQRASLRFQARTKGGRLQSGTRLGICRPTDLFPVVPRLFHRVRRATLSISIEFPLFPVFPGCEEGIQKTALIARASGMENIRNTLKAFAGIWEQTGNRTENTGTTSPPSFDISIPIGCPAALDSAPSPGSADSGRRGSCQTASTVPAVSAGTSRAPR